MSGSARQPQHYGLTPRGKRLILGLVIAIAVIFFGAKACNAALGSNSDSPARNTATRSEFGAQWPFIAGVDKVTFECGFNNAIEINVDGEYSGAYWFNGIAKDQGKWGDLTTIWADNPSDPGLKMDMEPVTDKALAYCQGGQ